MRKKLYVGSIIPFNISLEKQGNMSMSQYDFVICYYCSTSKVVVVPKDKAIKVDDDNYMFFVDTRLTGAGKLRFAAKALLPDTRLEDAIRPDIVDDIDSGFDVVKSVASNLE